MGTSAVIPPPPPGFTPVDATNGSSQGSGGNNIPPPPDGFSIQSPNPQQGSPNKVADAPGLFGRLKESVGLGSSDEDKAHSSLADIAKTALSFDMEKQLYSNTVAHLKAAKANLDLGHIGGAANQKADEELTRAIPFVGDTLANFGKDVQDKHYAGAAGGLVGILGQVIGPELLKGAKFSGPELHPETAIERGTKFAENATSTPNNEVRLAAQRQGITPTPGQASKGLVQFNERLLRNSSEEEAASYRAKDQVQVQKLQKNMSDIADSFLDKQNLPAGTTSEEAIAHLVDSAKKRFGDTYGEEAARINDLSGGNDSPLIENQPVLDAIKNLKAKFSPSDELASVSPQRGALLKELSDAQTMFDPELRAKANPEAADMPTKGDVVNFIRDTFRRLPEDTNDLVGARKVLRNAAKESLSESLPPYLRDAHNEMITNYAKGMDAIDSGIGTKIANKAEPEQIAKAFGGDGFGANSVQDLKTLIGEDKLPLVHNSFFKQLLEKSTRSGILNGDHLLDALDSANPQFLRTINPDQLARVRQLGQDAKTLNLDNPKTPKNNLYSDVETPDISLSHGGMLNLVLGKSSVLRAGAETVAKIARDPYGSQILSKGLRESGLALKEKRLYKSASRVNQLTTTPRSLTNIKQRLMLLVHQQELRDGTK